MGGRALAEVVTVSGKILKMLTREWRRKWKWRREGKENMGGQGSRSGMKKNLND